MEKNDIISDLSGVVAGTIVEASISTVAPGIGGILGGAVAGNLPIQSLMLNLCMSAGTRIGMYFVMTERRESMRTIRFGTETITLI